VFRFQAGRKTGTARDGKDAEEGKGGLAFSTRCESLGFGVVENYACADSPAPR